MRFIHEYLCANGGETFTPFSEGRARYTFTYSLPNGEGIDIAFQVMKEMGNVASASVSQRGIHEANPVYAFLLGIAGSMDEAAKLGDVVVATSVKYLSPDAVKKLTNGIEFASTVEGVGVQEAVADQSVDRPKDNGVQQAIRIDPRKKILENSYLRYLWRSVDREGSQFAADDYLSHYGALRVKPALRPVTTDDTPKLKPSQNNSKPSVHRGTVFGSDVVVDSDEYVRFVKDRDAEPERSLYHFKSSDEARKRSSWFPAPLLAVDMETYGFFKMAEALFGNSNVPSFFSIRGISDLAHNKSELDSDTGDSVRRRAVENALIIALDMLSFLVTKRIGARAG